MSAFRPLFLAVLGSVSLVALPVALVPVACGGDDAGTGSGDETTSGTAGGGTTTGGEGGGAGSTATGGAGGGLTITGNGGNGQGGEGTCLTTEAEGETLPLDLLVVLDRSKSMADQGLWQPTINALTQFVQGQAAPGVSVGMGFFPKEGVKDSCTIAHYTTPLLGFTVLPMDAQKVIDAMGAQTPAGVDTPTYGALYGSLQFANTFQDQNPSHVVAVVLASDGVPNSCPGNQNDPAEIAKVAKTAFDYNGVRTFAIAIAGANVADLDKIAAAGGTAAAIDVTQDINQLKTKLDEIRAKALSCAYTIPEPKDQEFDATKLNLSYTPGGSNTPQDIPQAENLQDCGDKDGWYYDDPQKPKTVYLCPKTCGTVSKDTGAKISFVFGCPTIVN